MHPPHCFFAVELIAKRLRHHGWKVYTTNECPRKFNHDWYIVMCPYIFKKNPPNKKRIIFQLEQATNDRWFTRKYIKILRKSHSILDYNLFNISYLEKKGIPRSNIHYVPLGGISDYNQGDPPHDKKLDVLFFGSLGSIRRRKMLDELKKNYAVHIIKDIYGREVEKIIKSARLVVNIHYYENGILETDRIWRCLSLGVPVVSETSQDQDNYPELKDGVIFFKEGSISSLLSAVKKTLAHPVEFDIIKKSVANGEKRFLSMFDQFLLSKNLLNPPKRVCEQTRKSF